MDKATVKCTRKSVWHDSFLSADYDRIQRLYRYCGLRGLKYLAPWHFYLDFVEVSITTRCNLQCPGCANLMPFYQKPYDVDSSTVLQTIRKIGECIDLCGNFRLLGGEPFLHPDLPRFLAEIPSEKCLRISIPTNATLIPQDPDLYEALRNKHVTVVLGNYPASAETQKLLIAKLEQECVSYELPGSGSWIDYGATVSHERSPKALRSQFLRCRLRSKSVLNGVMYYCPRHSHGFDLGMITRHDTEYVDILNNTASQNRKQIRKLMWRHKPVEACKYCLRGTDAAVDISRGK